jgi:hypothetical protein
MLFVLGSTVTFIVYVLLRPWIIWKRIAAIVVISGLGAGVVLFAQAAGWMPTGMTRGSDRWNSTPIKESILLLALLAGMFLRVVWDAVESYRARKAAGERVKRPVFDKWDFVVPALIALLVFQPVLSMGGGQPMSIQLALFSLQNGFFWNSLFARIRQGREQSASA